MTSKTYVRRIVVPIYNVTVFIVVAEDAAAERGRKRWVDMMGPAPSGPYNALCSRWGPAGELALFFNADALLSGVVAHEVFHLTHRILEWTGEPFDNTKHEQGASLHEYLVCRIAACLNSYARQKKGKRERNR